MTIGESASQQGILNRLRDLRVFLSRHSATGSTSRGGNIPTRTIPPPDPPSRLCRFGGIGGEGLLYGTAQVMLVGKLSKILTDRMWKDDRIRSYVQKVVDAFPRRGHVGMDLRRGPPT